jgi:asparagine synthase (glutamine-hydrolysing)
MCGISGRLSATPLSAADRAACDAMAEALTHRGPDGAGRIEAPHLRLDNRRLSIIDVHGGWQPLYNEDRTIAVVANGEIYNYRELAAELTARGHQLRTVSDIEVIAHLYEELGDDCVHRLRGMFAFALWDATRQRALIVRDRMGEKPLYVHERDGCLTFASELRALVRSGAPSGALDHEAIDHYFHFMWVPEPRTPLADVRKLDAGHRVVVELSPWRVTTSRWWNLEDAPPLDADPATTVRAMLEEIAPLVVRSDVPVGVALSGGLDSSTVAALAAPHCPGLMAFSVGYEGRPPCDERADAARFAADLRIPLTEIECRTTDVVESFPQVCRAKDDPIADISGYGYWALMQKAREQQVPVLLMGQGGDELFWGYDFAQEGLRQTLRKQRALQQGHFALRDYVRFEPPPRLSPWGLRKWWRRRFGWADGLAERARDMQSPPGQFVSYDLNQHFQQARAVMRAVYGRAMQGVRAPAEQWFTFDPTPACADIRTTSLMTDLYLREDGIAQGDRLGMSASVEVRLPLVDHRLVECVIGLRKLRPDGALPAKQWIRDAVRGLVPDYVLARTKRGFEPPYDAWLTGLTARYSDSLRDGALVQAGILSPEGAAMLADQRDWNADWGYQPFAALVLEEWLRGMIDAGLRISSS